jgi:hypothetical protein
MKTYQECLEWAHQLQRQSLIDKKDCYLNIGIHPSDGFFGVFISSGDKKEYCFIEKGEGVVSDFEEAELNKIERIYNSIPMPDLQTSIKESI